MRPNPCKLGEIGFLAFLNANRRLWSNAPVTTESNIPKDSALVEVDPKAQALVEDDPQQRALVETEPTTKALTDETVALIDAIKRKAQAETQRVGEFSREQYLDAIRKARAEVEASHLFDPDRIAESIQAIQEEVEKNWEGLVKEITDFGDRLNDAAQAAWEKLTEPRPR
jgi:hypothetical protein